MRQIVFLPGFDGNATLRREFVRELSRHREALGVSYPNRVLGSLDQYRVHASGEMPVDWTPVIVAESFSSLVAARWAAVDPRVQALVLCGGFARNPIGQFAALAASMPGLVKMGQELLPEVPAEDAPRRRWSDGFTRTLVGLDDRVLAERLRIIATEDVGELLGRLGIPVVLMQFQADLVIGRAAREHLESVCRRPRVIRFPGPHFSIETRPRECAEAIHAVLTALFPPPTPKPQPPAGPEGPSAGDVPA